MEKYVLKILSNYKLLQIENVFLLSRNKVQRNYAFIIIESDFEMGTLWVRLIHGNNYKY